MTAEDPSKYYKLSAVIDGIVDDFDLTNHWYRKFLKWGIRGIEELAMDSWTDVKTCLLPVTSRKTVTLPGDFVDWVKVGGQVGQYCVTIGTNSSLALGRSDDTQFVNPQVGLPNGIDFSAYEGYYFFNYGGSNVFGLGYGLPAKGKFRISNYNNVCKELLLDTDFGYDNVYIEYITNGFDPCGETVIHSYIKDYVEKYVRYQYEDFNNPKATESSIARRGRDVHFAELKVRARSNPLTPQVMLDLSRKDTRLTPKI